MRDLLRLRDVAECFVVRAINGQAERGQQQSMLVLVLQAQSRLKAAGQELVMVLMCRKALYRLECQAAGQEHGLDNDVQDRSVHFKHT